MEKNIAGMIIGKRRFKFV